MIFALVTSGWATQISGTRLGILRDTLGRDLKKKSQKNLVSIAIWSQHTAKTAIWVGEAPAFPAA